MNNEVTMTFSMSVEAMNRFLKAIRKGDPEFWDEIKDGIEEKLREACVAHGIETPPKTDQGIA
jgi:hypothetical protein